LSVYCSLPVHFPFPSCFRSVSFLLSPLCPSDLCQFHST
jgi:hypothetical protein